MFGREEVHEKFTSSDARDMAAYVFLVYILRKIRKYFHFLKGCNRRNLKNVYEFFRRNRGADG